MKVLRTRDEVRAWRATAGRVGLVPTMGALHAGHLSLVERSVRENEATIASIFVNPTQFGPREDLSRYPRDLAGDLAKCAAAGVDRVLAPADPAAMFPPGFETWVTVERVSQGLCGASRPGHFRGVATVVAKLLNLTRPHAALFGEKDWQQLQVIRTFVRDLPETAPRYDLVYGDAYDVLGNWDWYPTLDFYAQASRFHSVSTARSWLVQDVGGGVFCWLMSAANRYALKI